MLTTISTPDRTFFAGNPVQFKLNSDNSKSVGGYICQFQLVVSAADITAGHIITFAFPDKTLVFTNVSTPDDSGTQVQKGSTTGEYNAWAQRFFDCLRSNFEFCSRMSFILGPITGSNRVIWFTALERSARCSPYITTNLVTVLKVGFFPGADIVMRNNFSIIGGIWDIDYNQIAQDIKPVDYDGNVTFNFSEYLTTLMNNHLVPYFTFPFDPANLLKRFPEYVMPFYAGFAERYDGTIKKVHFDTLRYAVPGGLNRETIIAYNTLGTSFFDVEDNQKAFLTWAPDFKQSSPAVPEKLFFYLGAAPSYGIARIAYTVYFTDGTHATGALPEIEVQPNDVVELSIGYSALNLDTTYPTQTVSSWSVWFQGAEGTAIEETPVYTFFDVSEKRTFVLDPAYYENERIFIFQNSFGKAWDVVRFTGKGYADIALEFLSATNENTSEVTFYNAPSVKFAASELQKLRVNSGWVTKEMKDYFRELLLSKEVYELIDDQIFPVIITTDKSKEHLVDDQYLYNLEIEYDRAYRDFFFQNIG